LSIFILNRSILKSITNILFSSLQVNMANIDYEGIFCDDDTLQKSESCYEYNVTQPLNHQGGETTVTRIVIHNDTITDDSTKVLFHC
jgi:hypothetical protein